MLQESCTVQSLPFPRGLLFRVTGEKDKQILVFRELSSSQDICAGFLSMWIWEMILTFAESDLLVLGTKWVYLYVYVIFIFSFNE